MHKLGRGKAVLIYAGKKGHSRARALTHTHTYTGERALTHTSAHILDKRERTVYNMYTEDNANSSPKNNTPAGLCNFFRFVLFASFPSDMSSHRTPLRR